MRQIILIAFLLAALPSLGAKSVDKLLPVPAEIRREACRPNDDPVGHPLPLVEHYLCGGGNLAFSPAWQLQMIEQGHFLLPWFVYPSKDSKTDREPWKSYYEEPLKKARALGLPITLMCPQWDLPFSYANQYTNVPPEKVPCVIGLDGKLGAAVDPLGPPDVWREAGKQYMTTAPMTRLQELYPDPPALLFVESNAYSRFSWPDAEKSKRYVDRYGTGRDDVFKRRVFIEGWLSLGRAMHEGFYAGLTAPAWKKARFTSYGALGPQHFARPTDWTDYRPDGDWKDYSNYLPGRINPGVENSDGGAALCYAYDFSAITDYTVWSTQVESMNWVFMEKETFTLNPNYWLELATWDGRNGPTDKLKIAYTSRGQTYTPERYAGTMQYSMWLLRPRVVRQWPGWINGMTLEQAEPYFLPFIAAVDRVHTNPILRRFWRKGVLVPNRAHLHPYQLNVPDEFKAVDRWFLLDTSLDPPRPWELKTELQVFSLALTQGRKPNRQWLIYAHAPQGERKQVEVTIPEYKAVTIDVAVGGSFYLVEEKAKRVTAVPE